MVKVIACKDRGWIDQKTDYRQWDHACRAYGADLQMVDDLSEACCVGEVVVMEEQGDVLLEDFKHPKEATYVFGRSCLNGLQNMINHDHVVKISTPEDICLFGITAVGIVLEDRKRKNGSNNI